jgi:hypothetical protein
MKPRTFTAVLWLGNTPPSLNAVAGRGNRFAFIGAKRKWQTLLGTLLMAECVPRDLDRVEATAVLSFPTRRRRDEGNYRALLEKALGDALVEGGWLSDDTSEQFRFGALDFQIGEPLTELTLRCQRAAPAASTPPESAPHVSRSPHGHGAPTHG